MENATGFLALFRREVSRFMKIVNQTVLAPLISSFLFITVFGVFIGSQVSEINGVPYINFLIPGLVMMGLITGASSHTSFSLLQAKFFKHVEEFLTSPLSYFEMSLAITLAGAVRGIVVGIITLLVGLLFTNLSIHNIFVFSYFMFFSAILFSSIGVVIGLWARTFDHVGVFSNFIIMPLVFFGGVFYSLSNLPQFLQAVSAFNPLLYMINGFRYGMLGITDVDIIFSGIFLLALTLIFFALTVHLFKKGYRIKT